MKIDVRAQREGEHYCIECSECGPLGVCTEVDTVPTIKAHLLDIHRADFIQED